MELVKNISNFQVLSNQVESLMFLYIFKNIIFDVFDETFFQRRVRFGVRFFSDREL